MRKGIATFMVCVCAWAVTLAQTPGSAAQAAFTQHSLPPPLPGHRYLFAMFRAT